jgi:AAA15 family ATPase/GTPase
MDVEITLKNYRCFSDEQPARFVIRNGFSALVGINNSGKSTILRFFYEFRRLFSILSEHSGNFLNAVRGEFERFNLADSVLDVNEVFCKFNDRNIVVEIAFLQPLHNEEEKDVSDLFPSKVIIEVPHGTTQYLISCQTSQGNSHFSKNSKLNFENGYLCEAE